MKKSSTASISSNFNANKNFKNKEKNQAENKNSILSKFRSELHKSQGIIQKELIRSNELKQKFLHKRRKERELEEEEKKKLLENPAPINVNEGVKKRTHFATQNEKFIPNILPNVDKEKLRENSLTPNKESSKRSSNLNVDKEIIGNNSPSLNLGDTSNNQLFSTEIKGFSNNLNNNFNSTINVNNNTNAKLKFQKKGQKLPMLNSNTNYPKDNNNNFLTQSNLDFDMDFTSNNIEQNNNKK